VVIYGLEDHVLVVLTHTNADFDALAGMTACAKLYPGAKLMFPGSIERNLKDFIEKNRGNLPEIASPKSFDFAQVEKFVLVDVAAKGRLGALSQILENKPVDVYDHHPGLCDVRGDIILNEESGAVTSILTEVLEKRSVGVTPFEATLFLLGIYEDTGFLTFPTTRLRDFEAAKRCLGWGAQLAEVSRWLHRRLTEGQMRIITKLVENLEYVVVGGIKVHITTFISPEFIPDLSLLVHELLNIEDMEAIFLVAFLESRVHIIARSRTPFVDVGKVLEAFQGGGHPSAASATIKGSTLDEAKRALIDQILMKDPVGYKAGDFCQRDFSRGSSAMTILEILEQMNRERVNALPVFEGKKLVGVVNRQEVDRAIQHKLGKSSVLTLIAAIPLLFSPDTPVEVVYKKILEKSSRLILVGDSPENVVGLITRMQLFKQLYEKSSTGLFKSHGGTPSAGEVLRTMDAFFLKDEMKQLMSLGELASRKEMRCYLVGGVVRDILLHNQVKDLDFVVEGDAAELVSEWAKLNGGRVRSHSPFGTAIWLKPKEGRWDFATARTEYYEFPGALPVVTEAPLTKDLARRDFTINSMAISLNPGDFGNLLDPFGGIKDLRQCQIRILHGLSFIEDPTRAFRAFRFAAKLNFTLSQETRQQITNALRQGVFQNLSAKRVLSEMIEILRSPSAVEALRLLEELQVLKLFWRSLKLTPKLKERLYKAQKVADFFEINFPKEDFDRALLMILSLTDRLSNKELPDFTKAYPFSKKMKELLRTYRETTWNLRKKFEFGRKSRTEAFKIFESYPLILLLHYLSRCEKEEEENLLRNYILKDRFITLRIDGNDLKKSGLKPGGHFAFALLETKAAKIEGKLKNRDDEFNFALEAARRHISGNKES
jgi:tRNA nucleotidyltransferase (CCA-adding enzyme)